MCFKPKQEKGQVTFFPFMKWPSSMSHFAHINLLQSLSANCWRNGVNSDKKITWSNLFCLRLSSDAKWIATQDRAARAGCPPWSPQPSCLHSVMNETVLYCHPQAFAVFHFLTALDPEEKPNRFGNQFGPSRPAQWELNPLYWDLGRCLPGH